MFVCLLGAPSDGYTLSGGQHTSIPSTAVVFFFLMESPEESWTSYRLILTSHRAPGHCTCFEGRHLLTVWSSEGSDHKQCSRHEKHAQGHRPFWGLHFSPVSVLRSISVVISASVQFRISFLFSLGFGFGLISFSIFGSVALSVSVLLSDSSAFSVH